MSTEENSEVVYSVVNNPLGFSVIHEYQTEKQSVEGHIDMKSKQGTVWIPDEGVSECSGCQAEFSFLNRKHHCRCCGLIFCHDCSPFRRVVPATWRLSARRTEQMLDGVDSSDSPQRLCFNCNQQIDLLAMLDRLIQVFRIAGLLEIEVLDQISLVCQLWRNLSDYFWGQIRNVQYRPWSWKFSQLEKDLLWLNRDYWIGHSHYTMILLRSLDYNSYYYRHRQHQDLLRFLAQVDRVGEERLGGRERLREEKLVKKRVGCLKIMCTKNCCQQLRPYHAILLTELSSRGTVCQELDELALWVLSRKVDDLELRVYLPYLVDKLKYYRIDSTYSYGQFLIEKAKLDLDFAVEFYWNLIYQERENRNAIYGFYSNLLMEQISLEGQKLIMATDKFVKLVVDVPNGKGIGLFEVKDYLRKQQFAQARSPMNPMVQIEQVLVQGVSVKKSYSMPLMLPFAVEDQTCRYTILYKRESVMEDYLVLKVIELMKYLLAKYEQIEISTVDYKVCPLDRNSGFIQIVPDCQTTYEIKEKMKFSIFNFIVENNPGETVEVLRRRFVKSCATYCVITYLLGVGDRHLDNIMITKDGVLFHIDYGFVLGADPKPISQPKMRITKDMVDALGGYQSVYYQEFLRLCNQIFEGLRGHLNLFIAILSLLVEKEDDYLKMVKLLTSRFMPGETQKTAIVQLEGEIFRSAQQNVSESVIDFFHYHAKEETVSQIMESGAQGAKSVISGTSHLGKKVGGALSKWWYK